MKAINSVTGCLTILLALNLSACGGGGGEGEPVDNGPEGSLDTGVELTGVFIDSTVQGLAYSSATISGVTNAGGEFTYHQGEQVSFSVGGIMIGQALGAAVITPVDLVAEAVDETNAAVTRIARFLQTLDDDGNPDNGIAIPSAVASAAEGAEINFESESFDTNTAELIAEFTTLTSSGLRELVSVNAAQAHLQTNLYRRITGQYSGTYMGTLDYGEGSEPWSGSWELAIDDRGNVSGTSTDQEGDSEFFNGQINSSGAGVSGGSNDGSGYTLSVDADGNVSGTWSWTDTDNASYTGGGSLAGSKTVNQSDESANGNLITSNTDVATGEATWPPATSYPVTFSSSSEEVTSFDNPSLDTEGDQHWWSFSGQDDTFFFFVKTGADHQANDNTDMACVANIFDQNGNMKFAINPIQTIAADDGFHRNCEIIFTPSDSKTYYLRVRASDSYSVKTGAYTLVATRDTHTEYSTATNASKSYQIEGKVLNRHYKISRAFTMPDIRAIFGLFQFITDCQIVSASAGPSFSCPSPAFYDANDTPVGSGPVGDYRMDLGFGPMFLDETTSLLGDRRLYDWTTVPRYEVVITNPNPLPNYDPDFPYCIEGYRQALCTTQNVGGIPSIMAEVKFDAYNTGWTSGDFIPLSKTCADLGYSSNRSIIQVGSSTVEGLRGTCRYSDIKKP